MVVDVLRVDSRECARADVEHDLVDLDALFSDAVEEGLGEVESGRRGGNAAGLTSVDGLVSLPVARSVGAVDVGRKRKMAEFLEQVEDPEATLELHGSAAVLMDGHHATPLVFVKLNDGVDLKLPSGTDEGAEVLRVGGFGTEIEHLRLASPQGAAKQPRGHDAASIDDQEVALTKEMGEFQKAPVLERTRGSLKGQKARGVAFREGLLGDPVRRQVEVEVAGLQKSFFCGRSDSGRSRPKCL
jgi:hypothetical protein